MIGGVVNARREATLRLRLRGPTGVEANVIGLVDTGFTAAVALPPPTIVSLKLVGGPGGRAKLGDGSVREFHLYAAEVDWDGAWRPVVVSAVGREALVGLRLLAGHRLTVDVVPGGAVEVTALP